MRVDLGQRFLRLFLVRRYYCCLNSLSAILKLLYLLTYTFNLVLQSYDLLILLFYPLISILSAFIYLLKLLFCYVQRIPLLDFTALLLL